MSEKTIIFLMIFCGWFTLVESTFGQGGCGSVCLPLEALNPALPELTHDLSRFLQSDTSDSSILAGSQRSADVAPDAAAEAIAQETRGPDRFFSIIATTEFANFHRFREGSDEIVNAGGNEAFIHSTTMFFDYGVTPHSVISFMLPYVRKIQFTNRFGFRSAEHLGDIALFGRHEVIRPCKHGKGPSVWMGLGLKFPTGDIEDPNGRPRLPPPFQTGSGAYDLVPTLNYYQNFDNFSLFGLSFIRFPLEANRLDYEFGNEYEAHFGVNYPLRICCGMISLMLSLDYLYAEHDKAFRPIVPARLLDGVKVLNTGGSFLDLTPGFSIRLTKRMTLSARLFLPVEQDWNGDLTRTPPVGQVAQDLTTQITLVSVF